MSIKTQKIIMYIPIFNFYIFLYWIFYWVSRYKIRQKDFILTMLYMFISLFVITFPRGILANTLKNETLDNILFYISLYLIPLVIDYWIIRCEKKYNK